MRIRQIRHVAGILNNSNLHTQTNPQIRNLVFTRILNCQDFPFDTTLAKATWHQNGMHAFKYLRTMNFHVTGIDVFDIDLGTRLNTGMTDRFDQ